MKGKFDVLSTICHLQMLSIWMDNAGILVSVNSLPNDKFLYWFKFKAIADNKIIVDEKMDFVLGTVENIAGKRRKCWLPAFSPFPTMFSKGFFPRIVKSRDCLVMGLKN